MQSRNGDTAGDESRTRVHHRHKLVFSASQWVPGKEGHRVRWGAAPALEYSFFPGTWPPSYSVLIVWQGSKPHPFSSSSCVFSRPPYVILLSPYLDSSSSDLFPVILGSLALPVKRNRAPTPNFSKELFEVYTFLLGSHSGRNQWNVLKLKRNGYFLYIWVCLHICGISCFSLLRSKISRSKSVTSSVTVSPASQHQHTSGRGVVLLLWWWKQSSLPQWL